MGALIGIEREKHKAAESEASFGGLRTFILIALLGAISGWLARTLDAPWVLVAALLVVSTAVLVGYAFAVRAHPDSVGMTTESAAIVVCLLGAMATLGHREIAVPLAIVTAVVLAYKQPLHGLVAKLGWDDIHAGLRLLLATFIVLPLLPDRTVDPWGALNPYSLWLLVLLISTLSLLGYVTTRWLGPGKGAMITGLAGGLVSSTAVTLSFARQAREDPGRRVQGPLVAGMLLAWCVMFGRVITEVIVVNRSLAVPILPPFLAMAAAALVAAWMFSRGRQTARAAVPLHNPFSLTAATKFAAYFALILLVVKLVQSRFPGQGLYVVAALAGFTDVDAITLSMAEYARTGDPRIAVGSIVIAAITNTAVKCGIATVLGGPALRRPVLIATAMMAAAGIAAIAIF
jgi:uncharacterized membrane protein (DUF4010 family)